MTKYIAASLFTCLLATSIGGCKKIYDAVFPGLDVDIPEISITVPFFPVPPGTPVPPNENDLVSFTQKFNLDSMIKAKTNGEFGIGDITSVKLKQMVFTIANPDTQNNFSNFESARFKFSSNTNTASQDIAAFTFPDTYTPTVSYNAPETTPELLPYLKGTELTYRVAGKIRRYTTKALNVSINVTMKVK